MNLKEIAEICGVSVATVSRVINQNGRFSKETDRKVREVIQRYHYQPNQIAKGLRSNKMDAIGVIVPDITNEFFSALILSLQEELFRNSYSCIIFNTNESPEIESQCVANLLTLNISGIISVNSGLDLDESLLRGIPVVYVDRAPKANGQYPNAIFLSSDHENGAYLAGKELAECGCRQAACITALPNASATKMRNRGFARACGEFGMALPPERVFVPKEASLNAGFEIVDAALREGARFDGLFCQTDWLAIGALTALIKHEIRVPQEVQLVGFDDIRATRIAQIPITTIHQQSEIIGARAAEYILQMAEGKQLKGVLEKIPVRLVRRMTTRYSL